MLPALAGANVIYGLGMVESGMTFDFGQLVMDNEFARMIRFTIGGIPVDDNSLAVDVTREIGPFKDFLSHPHTFQHMRAQSECGLLDRRNRIQWEKSGAQSMRNRAMETARKILKTHKPEPLADSVRKQITEIIREAEKEKGV